MSDSPIKPTETEQSTTDSTPRFYQRWGTGKRLAAVVGIVALVGVGTAGAKGWSWHNMDEGSRIERVQDRALHKATKRLELNASQQSEFTALTAQLATEALALRDMHRTWRDDLQGMMGETMDREAAKAYVAERIAQLSNAQPAMIDAMADFYDTLDATQQEELREMLERRGRKGRGHGDG